ncbi:SRPBCC family protein [Rhodococcoides corynebacterioides]|uniref:Polyketide cyclase / dehydrase and lipid transport n=1 Tax=Rhodococcoides corynebacterioides TaxID=53972 RepID=A0ABS7P2Y3_9NOCA|nr:SRPBCC family protein [Rhodococcus corynebacterioides]MBY6366680.1 polyketide cyclase / dehydrase and lipid transport [Rhodococcus corynebacterioides]MBY6408729.1 polyketide cyclase / dehydrase and lipid transport [Rhodococcus corynebacterioides]
MSSVQVADQTFVAAPPADIAAVVGDPRRWRSWFPRLTVTVTEDRGDKGVRWAVAGELVGTMEVWLEPSLDGAILHYFLHAEPTDPAASAPVLDRARRVAGKAMSFEVKGLLEAGRAPGEAPAHTTSVPGTDPGVRT